MRVSACLTGPWGSNRITTLCLWTQSFLSLPAIAHSTWTWPVSQGVPWARRLHQVLEGAGLWLVVSWRRTVGAGGLGHVSADDFIHCEEKTKRKYKHKFLCCSSFYDMLSRFEDRYFVKGVQCWSTEAWFTPVKCTGSWNCFEACVIVKNRNEAQDISHTWQKEWGNINVKQRGTLFRKKDLSQVWLKSELFIVQQVNCVICQ